MKTLSLLLSPLMVLVITTILAATVGCHNPSAPPSSPEDRPLDATKWRSQPTENAIPLDGVLKVPGRTPNSLVSIKGQVFYSLRSTTYRDVHRVSLELSTNATLIPDETGKTMWNVAGKSHDQCFVSEEGIAVLEKRFKVEGAQGRMILTLRFLISQNGVGLNGMWLEQINEPREEQQTG